MKTSFFKMFYHAPLIYFLIITPSYSLCMYDIWLKKNHKVLKDYKRPVYEIDFCQQIAEYKGEKKFNPLKTENGYFIYNFITANTTCCTLLNNPDHERSETPNKKLVLGLFSPIAESLLDDPRIYTIGSPKTEGYYIHSPKHQWRCLCIAPFKGKTLRGMSAHIELKHQTEEFFTCPYLLSTEHSCSKKSKSATNIVRHLKKKHAAFKICCNELFDLENYRIHVTEEGDHKKFY